MLKKIFVSFLVFLLIFLSVGFNDKPIFRNYSNEYEVYLNSASSTAQIKKVGISDFYFIKNLKGESAYINKNEFDLLSFLTEFNAEILFLETTEQGVSYYAFSPKIKYQTTLNNQCVNLHVHISEQVVKVGAPLIFGSF